MPTFSGRIAKARPQALGFDKDSYKARGGSAPKTLGNLGIPTMLKAILSLYRKDRLALLASANALRAIREGLL